MLSKIDCSVIDMALVNGSLFLKVEVDFRKKAKSKWVEYGKLECKGKIVEEYRDGR